MSWVITAIAVTATAGAVSARGQYVAGKTQQIEMERQAEEERIAAQSRELQRREELNRALAANVVGQAMSGISGEGTPASLKQAQLRRQGRSAKQAGYLQATSTLLQTGARAAALGSGD